MATPTVKLRTTGTQFPCPKSEHCLLEILELQAVEVEYQCRSGYCGSCRMKLVKGKVSYCQPPLALINDGEILPCCCMPLMDIELDL
jgi:ferredoxin